ncbi:MAG: polar amino acid transport system substrate-binding protein [Oceanospirillaceae bacterium]|jgi:polar amino acid transport system substrate-binding protein
MLFFKIIFLRFLVGSILLFGNHAWAQKVSMVTTQWEPFYSSNLPAEGVITEVAKAAFQRENHQASVSWYPWMRALKIAAYGEADVVMGAYYSEERSKKFYYSDPIFSIDVGLIALKSLGIVSYEKLDNLKPYKIGVMRGWVYTQEFDQADFLDKHTLSNQVTAVRMLLAKRVNIIAASIPVFQHEISLLKSELAADTVVLKPLLESKPLYLMFNRVDEGNEKLLADFNRGLAKIRADGTFDKILDKHGFKNFNR